MKKHNNYFTAITFFIILFVSSLLVTAQTEVRNDEKNILVLHSYHQGLEWTDNISKGIQSVFDDKANINLIFEYLDAKRNFSDEYFEALKGIHQEKSK